MKRWGLMLWGLAVAFVVLLPASGGAAGLPGVLTGTGSKSPFAVRPPVIDFTGDSTGDLGGFDGNGQYPNYGHLNWSTWTQTEALGSGAVWLDDCTPSCANGRFLPYAVTVRAFAPESDHFTRLTLRYLYHGKEVTDIRGVKKFGSFYQYFIVSYSVGNPPTGPCKLQVTDKIVALAVSGCFLRNGTRYSHSGAAKINGLDVVPRPGANASVVIDLGAKPPTLSLTGAGEISVGGIPLRLFGPGGGTISLADTISLTKIPGKLHGFGFAGPLTATFQDGEVTTLDGSISLKVLGDDLEAGIDLDTSNAGGLDLSGLLIHLSDEPVDPRYTAGKICNPKTKPYPSGWDCAPDERLKNGGGHWRMIGNAQVKIGWLPIKELFLQYRQHGPVVDGKERGEWSGYANVQFSGLFPGAAQNVKLISLPSFKLNADFLTDPFAFHSLGASFADLNVPLVDGFFLQDAGLGFGLQPLTLGGTLRVTMGPEVAGKNPLAISGGFSYAQGTSEGFDVKINGKLDAFELPQIDGDVEYDSRDGGAKVKVDASVSKDFGPVHLDAGLHGGMAFGPFHVQLHGDGSATIWGQGVNANAVLSDAGIGACGQLHVLLFSGEIGFTHYWNGDTHFFTCDLSGLYTIGGATAAALGRTVTLPAGLAHAELAAVGATAPPAVTLIEPGGEQINSPTTPDQTELHPHVLALAESGVRTTLFLLDHPPAGRWQIVPQPGSVPVRYLRANPTLDPRIAARVTGSASEPVLSWSYVPQPGRSVTFVEQGPFTERTIATNVAARGRLSFRPGAGPGGTRQIVALVAEDRLVRQTEIVASFRAAPRSPVGRPRHVTYHVTRGALAVRWRRASSATGYEIDVQLRNRLHLRVRVGHVLSVKLELPTGARVSGVRVLALGGELASASVSARRV